jgi:hypothetical protein
MLDFLGIGAQKAGTTWLYQQLSQHPDVMPCIGGKEIHYFDVLYLNTPRRSRINYIRKNVEKNSNRNFFRGNISRLPLKFIIKKRTENLYNPTFLFTDEWYRKLFSFAPSGKTTGEITPLYCALPDEGILHIKRLMPKTPIIYLIRDPYDRAISSLSMRLGWSTKNDPLKDDLFFLRGDYRRNVPRWDAHFSGRVLYLPFGDIRDQPLRLLRKVEKHIGLREFHGYRSIEQKRNAATGRGPAITDDMKSYIRERVADQYGFLRGRFGDAFVERIK